MPNGPVNGPPEVRTYTNGPHTQTLPGTPPPYSGNPANPNGMPPAGSNAPGYTVPTSPYNPLPTPAPGSVIPHPSTVVPGSVVITPTAPVYAPGTVITPNAPVYAPGTVITPTIIPPSAPVYTPGTTIIAPSTPALPTTPTYDPSRRLPDGKGPGAMNTTGSDLTPTSAKVETEATNPFDLARRYEKRVAHAADYSKLTGQLSYVHADGGLWVLRYAPLSEEDQYGGSVVLARDRTMNSYREGDLVAVEGQIISQKSSARLGGPLYRIQNISLVERPQ